MSEYKYKVDPIRYAWERCNPGVPFPRVLARSRDAPLAAPDPMTPCRYGLTSQVISADAAVPAALYSWGAPPRDGS